MCCRYDGFGQLLCTVRPVLGIDTDALDRFGRATLREGAPYIVRNDPCQWGDATDGLRPRPVLPLYGPHAFLRMRKLNNASFNATGEMAIWQMRGVYVRNRSGTWRG